MNMMMSIKKILINNNFNKDKFNSSNNIKNKICNMNVINRNKYKNKSIINQK